MVSIKDVAKHAGVAISTVSKVLNNYPNVTETTKNKVNRAIKELNYVPNSIAAALSSKHSGRVALLMDPVRETRGADQIYMEYILGALDSAREQGIDAITVFFSMLENMTVDDITRYLRSQGVQAIVVFGLSQETKVIRNLIQEEDFFTVVVDAPFVTDGITSVGIDHTEAQYQVAVKTIKENPGSVQPGESAPSVLYIAGRGADYTTADRTKGMKKAAEELKVSLSIRYGDFSEAKAGSIARFTGRDKDFIICASDLMAIGAVNALKETGRNIPVCGFDGIALMAYAGCDMNTVRQDFYEIANTAVKEAKRLMDGEKGRQVVMPHRIVRMAYSDIVK